MIRSFKYAPWLLLALAGGCDDSADEMPADMAPPSADMAPPADDMAPPAEDMAPPAEDMAPPAEDMAPPVEDMAPPAEDMAPPAEDMAPPEPDMAPVDDTPPVVEIGSPQMNDALPTWRIELAGLATDDVGLSTVQVMLGDAEPVDLEPDAEGAFAATLQPAPGLNTVRVVAEDASGNVGEDEVEVYFGQRSAAGGLHTGFVVDGRIWAWGRHNRGQVGIGPDEDVQPPVELPAPESVASIYFVVNSSIALTTDGRVWVWGDNGSGQLGLGDPAAAEPDEEHRFAPEAVPGIDDAVAVGRGFRHGLVLRSDGTVWGFGDNGNGQLGDGSTDGRDHPAPVEGLDDVIAVVGGSQHSVALRGDGTVWIWGRNSNGNLGDGTVDDEPHPTPAQVPMLADVVGIASGRDHTLAVRRDGRVLSWGLGRSGQLGIGVSGDEGDRPAPTLVEDIDDVARVFAGGNMSFALKRDGTLWGWGQNFNGQLGTGDTVDLPAPAAPVVGLDDIVDMGVGATHVTAVARDGAMFLWGWNARGSLGDAELLDNWPFPEPIEWTVP